MLNINDVKDLSSCFTSEHASKSVPNFQRCVLEQGIGHELRIMSDSFYLEFGGFVSLLCDFFWLSFYLHLFDVCLWLIRLEQFYCIL